MNLGVAPTVYSNCVIHHHASTHDNPSSEFETSGSLSFPSFQRGSVSSVSSRAVKKEKEWEGGRGREERAVGG